MSPKTCWMVFVHGALTTHAHAYCIFEWDCNDPQGADKEAQWICEEDRRTFAFVKHLGVTFHADRASNPERAIA